MREFFALLDRRNSEEKSLDRRVAIVAWAIHNCMSTRKDGEPWQVEDFMPGEKRREQTPDEMIEILMRVRPGENSG